MLALSPALAESTVPLEALPRGAPPLTSNDITLRALALRLQDGDDAALETFIRATQQRAFGVAWHMLGDYHAAEDALQDAYLMVYRDIRDLRDPNMVRSWFMRIVVNRCLRAVRRQRPRSLVDIASEELSEDTRIAERTGLKLAVRQALNRLSPTDRAVILLRDFMDLEYTDVAAALGVPLGTAKRRLFEARRRMAKMMEEPTK